MGAATAAAATTATTFMDWFQTTGQVIYVGVNLLYWLVVGAAAIFAALQAKRYVDFVIGVPPKKEREAEATVEIEDFVD